MQSTIKQILTLALVVVMMASAGCAGWGQDGPADNEPNQSNDTDDLEQKNGTNQSNTSDSPNQSGDSTNSGSDDDSDSSSGSGDSTESASSSSTDSSDSDSSGDSSESDSATGPSGSDSGGQSGEDSAVNGGDSDSSGDDSSGSDDSSGDGSGAGDDDSTGDTGAGPGDDNGGDGDSNGDGTGDDNGGDDNGTGDGDGNGGGEQQQTNLSITVTNAETGEPVEGLEVGIYLEGYGIGAHATTNEDGVAVFDPNDLPVEGEDRSDGKVRIVVDNFNDQGYQFPEGVESPSTEITLKEDNTFSVEVVPEERETHTLTVHAGEAIPVPDIPITIERQADGATTTKQTDDGGSADFEVYPGDYVVSGTDETGHTQTQDVTVDSDTAVMLGQLQRPQPEERTLTVAVIDQDGDRASGVPVEAVARRLPAGGDNLTQGVTDSEGLVEFSVYDGIQYTLSAGGDYTGSATITMDGNEHTTLYVEQRGASSPNETAALSSSGLPDASVSPR